MAAKKSESQDPTIKSGDAKEATDFPEGTHPAKSPSEVFHSAERYEYKDNPDKPDPSTVAQVVEIKE